MLTSGWRWLVNTISDHRFLLAGLANVWHSSGCNPWPCCFHSFGCQFVLCSEHLHTHLRKGNIHPSFSLVQRKSCILSKIWRIRPHLFSLSLLPKFNALNCLKSSQQLLANTGCRCKHDTGPHTAKFENCCHPSAHLTLMLYASRSIISVVIWL